MKTMSFAVWFYKNEVNSPWPSIPPERSSGWRSRMRHPGTYLVAQTVKKEASVFQEKTQRMNWKLQRGSCQNSAKERPSDSRYFQVKIFMNPNWYLPIFRKAPKPYFLLTTSNLQKCCLTIWTLGPKSYRCWPRPGPPFQRCSSALRGCVPGYSPQWAPKQNRTIAHKLWLFTRGQS